MVDEHEKQKREANASLAHRHPPAHVRKRGVWGEGRHPLCSWSSAFSPLSFWLSPLTSTAVAPSAVSVSLWVRLFLRRELKQGKGKGGKRMQWS